MANKLDQFIIDAPQVGTIELISYRKERKGDVLIADQVDITEERGIVNDHYGKKGNRQVTLIQKEHLQVVASILGKNEIDPKLTRRNIVVSGINLRALIGKRFQLGSGVVLEATGDCVPCHRMEENFGPGGYQAMVGHGGITCKVIQGGHIALGDKLSAIKLP